MLFNLVLQIKKIRQNKETMFKHELHVYKRAKRERERESEKRGEEKEKR